MAKPSKTPQPPKGTRDLYPDDLLKRRYIQNAWRDASLRCGFDEIEGPTFESTDLYSIKSGQGILNELFQTFSGKGGQETLDKLVERGQADFALRPEFTPTLARMYAARAKQLTKPCKWFTAGPYFRAERPQRGRLREFLQWNVDVIGSYENETIEAQLDTECIFPLVELLNSLGLTQEIVRLKLGSRDAIKMSLDRHHVESGLTDNILSLLDSRPKLKPDEYVQRAMQLNLPEGFIREHHPSHRLVIKLSDNLDDVVERYPNVKIDILKGIILESIEGKQRHGTLLNTLCRVGLEDWAEFDSMIVRGLAYYTGTVFEAIADGERAVAGGGRYDNLIELMGGPPTPAVGFAMGDVVLGNLLDDKNLMPEGAELMEAVARQQTSIRPEAFIAVPNNDQENKSAAQSLTAALRRGQESEAYLSRDDRKPWQSDRYTIPPLHTRTSYKSTTNPGKLRKDAEKQHAKYFIEIHAPNKVELTDMDKRESITSPTQGSFSTDPTAENYIGTAIKNLI